MTYLPTSHNMFTSQTNLKFLVTTLPMSAKLSDAIRIHWKEYLMEGTETCVLLIGVCFSGAFVYQKASPFAVLSRSSQALIMGMLVAMLTLVIVWSPFGRRTGAHFNPALTFTYYCLGFVHRLDTIFYISFQFMGAVVGVLFAKLLLGSRLSRPPVSYVVTLPGIHGVGIAFLVVFLFSGLLMGVVLFASNRSGLTSATPFMVAGLTIFFYAVSPTLSGFSVNPARSLSSALFAFLWSGFWIYLLAPCSGMLTAATLYLRWPGNPRIYCAKVLHDDTSSCPFYCHFTELLRENAHN